jgi:two-component system, OmpR family, sensor histidine kinase KdpD
MDGLRSRSVVPVLLAVVAVGITTVILRATDADLTIAALVYLVVVVLSALGGYLSGAIGAVLAYLALNYWFIPHYESFKLESWDGVVTAIAFGLAAVAAGFTVARINGLRRQAEEHERAAFDARFDAAVNESRAGFLAAMTHNLRTPLASIKASVETLEDPTVTLDEPTRAQLLGTAHEETERLERLVTKVLELSRIHAGAIEPRREPIDIGEITRGAVRRLRYLAARDRVHLTVADDAVVATVDPDMIELVLVVLIENALRVAPAGTTVAVDVSRAGEECEIRVIDRGPGVAPEHREKIFEEFVRVEGAPDTTGSGLGLAIARALVTAHGGTIGVEDTPCGGATFTVTVPADAGPDDGLQP